MDPSNLQETLKKIDENIAAKKRDIEKAEALARLKERDDFQLVFMQGYIEEESKELFDILTDPSGMSPYPMEKVHLMLEAISHFKRYVGTSDYIGVVEQNAIYAKEEIPREEDYRKEVTAEAAREER